LPDSYQIYEQALALATAANQPARCAEVNFALAIIAVKNQVCFGFHHAFQTTAKTQQN
jgi:hypothetical protein